MDGPLNQFISACSAVSLHFVFSAVAMSPFRVVFYRLYLFGAVKCAAVYPRALFAGCIPGIGTGEIARPKRPASALRGSDRINRTRLSPLALLQEYAVASAGGFGNGHPQADTPEKLLFQLFDRHIQVAGNESNFGFAHPYISLGGA
jgi:hypothetical protein